MKSSTRPATFLEPLSQKDPAVFKSIAMESERQETGLEMIASENYVSTAVMQAQGSVLTNKYAEGYPHKRYYGGCEYVDQVEALAIERLCKLFSAEAANVQPHSGSQANMAAYMAVLKPGEKLMGMSLSHGGHLTHGSPVNFSGKLYEIVSYGLHSEKHVLDYDQIRDLARKERPRVLVAGASAYPRIIDFARLGEIAREINAELIVDMAHIAGLVAGGLHPTPVGHATYVTSTTHKTLRGPRGGVILSSADRIKAINSQIFPGIQGGPLMHVIAAKAVAFGEALDPSFRIYARSVVENAQALAHTLLDQGLELVTGGTDNHLLLVDLTRFANGSVSGKDAETWLDQAGITVNKNTVPNETRSPFVTSGIRIGTPALTTRGLGTPEMQTIGKWIVEVLSSAGDATEISKVRNQVRELCTHYPLYR